MEFHAETLRHEMELATAIKCPKIFCIKKAANDTLLCLIVGDGISRGVVIFLDFQKVEGW